MLALSVTACAVKPQSLTTASVSSFAMDQKARVTADQAPVTQAVTLYEAMARAVKYNLDFHVELYNEALASEQLKVARLNALPSIAASAYYTNRNKSAQSIFSPNIPDRSRFADDVTLSWNVLDLGLSYVRAQQAADEVLIAEEKRRKIINRVIEDVRTAYWRAVSADRLVVGLRRLEGRVKKAYRNSVALEREGETSPLTALTYQRELVEVQQRIQRLEKDLSLAKIQLAALMNIKPGTHFTLAQPVRRVSSTKLPLSLDEMVHAALENRPEIRDIQYQLRINAKEGKAALLELLPTATLFGSANFDSDSSLMHGNWLGWGAKATWNALNVFKYPAKKSVIATKDEVLNQRALAITMAIMTQVHVSRVRYVHSRNLYLTAARHLKVQNGIRRQVREAASLDQASEQTLIREEMNTLASQVQADIAYAELQNAYANIYASMGLDPYGEDLSLSAPLGSVTASLERTWIERGDTSGFLRARASARRNMMANASAQTAAYAQPDAKASRGWSDAERRAASRGKLFGFLPPNEAGMSAKQKAALRAGGQSSGVSTSSSSFVVLGGEAGQGGRVRLRGATFGLAGDAIKTFKLPPNEAGTAAAVRKENKR